MEWIDTFFYYFKIILDYLIRNWIAISALVVSLVTLKRNSLKLDVTISNYANWCLGIILNTGEMITNDFGLLQINVKIINSSNFDIGFFDLRILDEKTGDSLNFYHDKQFNSLNNLNNRYATACLYDDGNSHSINLPNGNHGIIKAHSLTSFDVIVSPEQEINKLFLMFKTTKRKSFLKKPKHGYVNSPYEQFSESVSVELSNKPDYNKHLSTLNDE